MRWSCFAPFIRVSRPHLFILPLLCMRINPGPIAPPMVLIIDDDLAVRTSLNLLFRNEGYSTALASSEEEALRILAGSPVSLILLDLNFSIETSGREGMALLKKIRQQDADVPVILITGWGTI